MATRKKGAAPADRSISIRGSVDGSILNSGDGNQIQSESNTTRTDVISELQALRQLLGELKGPDDRTSAQDALTKAADELSKPAPQKDVVGNSLVQALTWAKSAEAFMSVAGQVAQHAAKIAVWLGGHWPTILSDLGFTR